MDYERVLLVKTEVFVYRIPPRQSNRGYRAADWGLDAPYWTGRLRAVAKGNNFILKLEDKNSGELFAKCPIDTYPGIAIENVLDSSRYFVIRLMDDTGRSMFVGLGFAERSDSFDLNVTLQDHFKHVAQEEEAVKIAEGLTKQPSLDLSLKEGQQLKLSINTKRTGDESNASVTGSTNRPKPSMKLGNLASGASSAGRLPPPPPPAQSRSRGSRAGVVCDPSPVHEPVGDVKPSQTAPLNVSSSTKQNNPSNVDLLSDLFGSTALVKETSTSGPTVSDSIGF